jgi:acyl-coenzyme A thioesterase PaaI-like protein
MTTALQKDPYAEFLHSNVVEATPERAVVKQPNLDELNNHVAVRHAGALYTAAYAASRALVAAAAGDGAEIELVSSVVDYTNFPSGEITSTAEPQGEGWDGVRDGGEGELSTKVVSVGEAGKPVIEADIVWRVYRRR